MKRVTWMVLLVFLFAGVALAGPLERLYKERDAGTLIDLGESDVAVLELETNPSTGFGWQADDLGQNVRIAARVFEPLNPGMLGTPGIEKIYVVGRSKGRSDLTFKYQRPFEKRTERSLRFKFNAKGKFKEALQVSSLQSAAATPATSAEAQANLSASLGLPTSYNYCSVHGGCPPLRNQGQCGACWAFATQGVLECQVKGKDGVSADLSEQYLINCNDEDYSCDGGWWAHEYNLDTYVYGEKAAGAPLESTMPFTASNGACNPPHAKAYKITDWGYACGSRDCTPTTAQIKQAIYDHGPVAVAVCVDTAFQSYSSGVFKGGWLGCYQVNHGVVLVGWDDSNSCWIMRNSWGPDWGESGYMRIGYGVSQIGTGASWVEYAGGAPSGDNATINGTYSIVANHSGKALDVWEWGTVDGTNIAQYNFWGGDSQKFNITPVDGVWHRITPAIATDQAVDVAGCVTDDGANIQTWNYWGGDCQQWRFLKAGTGQYRIIARNSGKCLDVLDASTADGANVIQYSCLDGAAHQTFKVVDPATGSGDPGSGSSSSGGQTTCQTWSSTNDQHVSAGRAYTQTSNNGCEDVTTYYAVGSNENMGTSGSTSTDLYSEDSGQTYHIGYCPGTSSSSSSSTSTSSSSTSSSSTSSSSSGCN